MTSTSDNDPLTGGGGEDVYTFANGSGQDRIVNGVAGKTEASGELDFAEGIDANQLWFARSGNDLSISRMGSQDRITVAGWYDASASQLREVQTADGLKIDSSLEQLVQAMASTPRRTQVLIHRVSHRRRTMRACKPQSRRHGIIDAPFSASPRMHRSGTSMAFTFCVVTGQSTAHPQCQILSGELIVEYRELDAVPLGNVKIEQGWS